MIALQSYETLSFDCYGTLIDWETGIVGSMRPLLNAHGINATDDDILNLFGRVETVLQRPPFRRYHEVLRLVAGKFAEHWQVRFSSRELDQFASSVPEWPAFPDSSASLARLAERFDLVILSNVDDSLFTGSAQKLGVPFTDVVTAEQVGSYKPDRQNFDALIERVGKPRSSILHVAQSLYHDIAPARQAGLSTVWVNRRFNREGGGATPAQDATPDLEVHSLAAFVTLVDEAFGR